jgi:membrane protease YdiL (CAAX protease family)
MSPGLLVTPVANTTLIIKEVLTGRITPGPFVLATISSCVYAGLFLSLAARLFTNEQLVNPSWEPISIKGLRPALKRPRAWRLPSVDEALALFSVALLLSFYVAPSLQRFGLVPMLVVQQVFLLAGPAIVLAWVGKYKWVETFSWRKPKTTAMLGGAMLGIGLVPWMQLVALLQQKFFPRSVEGQIELMRFLLPPLEQYPILIPVLIGVFAGVCEETLFRGPVQTGLLRRMPKWTAIVIASVLFAAAHLDLYGIPARTFLGVVLGWIVVHTGSVFPAMAMHAIYDIVQLLYVAYEVRKAGGAQQLLQTAASAADQPMDWWALPIGAASIIVGAILLRRSRREDSTGVDDQRRGFPIAVAGKGG